MRSTRMQYATAGPNSRAAPESKTKAPRRRSAHEVDHDDPALLLIIGRLNP